MKTSYRLNAMHASFLIHLLIGSLPDSQHFCNRLTSLANKQSSLFIRHLRSINIGSPKVLKLENRVDSIARNECSKLSLVSKVSYIAASTTRMQR